MGKVVFAYEFGAGGETQSPHPGHVLQGIINPARPIVVYPSVRSFEAKAKLAPQIDLSRVRSLLVELHSGRNDISDCTVRFKATTAGLRLKVHESTLFAGAKSRSLDCQEANDGQYLLFSDFPAAKSFMLSVPYTLENTDTTSLTARMEICYTTTEGEFVYRSTISINTILPVSVNVQDIFTEQSLLSRFTISPATLVPLRIESCGIDGSKQYSVESAIHSEVPMDVFPKQPASLLLKLTKRHSQSVIASTTSLALLVDFHCLDEVILSAIEGQFLTDIVDSPCAGLARLLTAHLLDTLRSQWTEQDLEAACLLQQVEVWPYQDIGWESTMNGLSKAVTVQARQWLHDWHNRRSVVPLHHTQVTKRQISIPVEIPTPDLILTIDLDVTSMPDWKSPIAIGEPLAADLKISHTSAWSKTPNFRHFGNTNFSYEVVASPDTWIVGGRRRGNFTVETAEQKRFQILLIPQKTGHLLLPSIDIKCNGPEKTDISLPPAKKSEATFEVDHQIHAKSVLVMPNLRGTTTVLDSEGVGGRTSLVGSRKRV